MALHPPRQKNAVVTPSAVTLANAAAAAGATGERLAALSLLGVSCATWRAVTATTGTVAAADNNQAIECTNAAATTITVPKDLGFPFSVVLLNSTNDAMAIAAGTDVTINSPSGALRVVCKNQPVVLVAKSANVFQAFGPLVA